MSERKLATIRKVSDIIPIEGADSICSYRIDGWNVVDRIGKYQKNDLVIYFEVDSWIPTEIAPFLSKDKEPREFNGVKGERLRTVKLRKTLSQGLIMPLSDDFIGLSVGTDVSEKLGIQKWEPPIPAELAGIMKGNFPTQIPKTDENRLQNLTDEFQQWKVDNYLWEVTEKLDGSSMTCYFLNTELTDTSGIFGVCSRNIDLLPSDSNTFWKVAVKNDIENKLRTLNRNLAIQGELCGPGIQSNRYNLTDHEFFVFNVYDIDNGKYLSCEERSKLVKELNLQHVPVINEKTDLSMFPCIEKVLEFAEGKSILNNNSEREGLVFKNVTTQESFKAISNKYLLKYE